MINKIRILNIDDSAFVRKLLRDIFSPDKDFILIEQAKNGVEALEILSKNKFDVITLDVEMPIKDGIQTLQEIMTLYPTPVVMLSTKTSKGAETTIEALNIGAVDFITKPTNIFSSDKEKLREEIIRTVKNAATVNVKSLNFKKVEHLPNKGKVEKIIDNPLISTKYDKINSIIAIGTSTGGPRALNEVIPAISSKIKAPILVVQHMPVGFTKSLAERLDLISELNVKEAQDKEVLRNGYVYIAPGGLHMGVKQIAPYKYEIHLEDTMSINAHKPSVDKMMYSLCETSVKEVIALIMTGMGNDGARGLEKLKIEKNAITIAQEQSSCVVYGMPKSAVETGKVDKVVHLNNIATELNKIMGV